MSRTEQMTEFDERVVAEAEADLDRLLSIEPSPEFAAKVRARIDAEPPARSWGWGRLLVPVAAAAAVVIVLTLFGNWSARGPEQPVAASRHDDIVLIAAKPSEATALVPVTPATDSKPPIRRAATPQRQEPEIMIDPAITDAIRRLALAARNTTLDGSKGESIAADAQSAVLPVAELLNVPELVLKPADQTGGQ